MQGADKRRLKAIRVHPAANFIFLNKRSGQHLQRRHPFTNSATVRTYFTGAAAGAGVAAPAGAGVVALL